MEAIREVIQLLHKSNARHRRKGFRYKDNTSMEMLKHAAEELVELVEAQGSAYDNDGKILYTGDILEELADLLMILLHYAHINRIGNHALQESMFDKFLKRFTLSRKERAAVEKLREQMRAHHFQKLRLYGDEVV